MKKYSLKNNFRKSYARQPFDFLLFQFSKNRTVDAFIYKIIPSHKLFSEKAIRKVKRNGLIFNLNISHIVDWYIYFGIRETARENLLNLIKNGMTLYDIGANIGDVTLHASQKLKTSGSIIAFEPHPNTFNRLQQNINDNNLTNIKSFNVGLGSHEGTFNMQEVENNPGANRIIGLGRSTQFSVIINVVLLDEFAQINNLPNPDIIKIDVEGFELEVIKGASNIIKLNHPILFIELSDGLLKMQNQSASILIKYISELGYRILNAGNNNPILPTDNLEGCHFDIIAIPIQSILPS